MEALVSGHPQDAKKVSVTGVQASYKNVKIQSLYIVWQLSKSGFCEGALSRAVHVWERSLGECLLYL